MQNKKFLILDCFVDEPACFGVPPFISPYPRYIYGALISAGINPKNIAYYTIDFVRGSDYTIHDYYDKVFLIGGAVVPGKYLGEKIGTIAEIDKIVRQNRHLSFAIGGPVKELLDPVIDNIHLLKGDIEKFAYTCAKGDTVDGLRDNNDLREWAIAGCDVVRQHPDYPNVICEMETYRGCPRLQHCSFCYEGGFHSLAFREVGDIIAEIDSLISCGINRFRLGRQADILQYKTNFKEFKNGFSKPEIQPVLELFKELQTRREQGGISVLNIDNANPGTIAHFPEESSLILEGIVAAISPGDTLALGIESFDPAVIAANNLKVSAEEAFGVIKLINAIGGKRVGGIAVLLPGINLIHGLIAENHKTFELNYTWLRKMLEADLLIKRINIRKLIPFPGTMIARSESRLSAKTVNRFDYYRAKIRSDIDTCMLKKLYPPGTIIKDNYVHEIKTDFSYGKQIASYSITVKYPVALRTEQFHDALIVGHRERSVIGLPLPVNINMLSAKALECIPGIGKKRATEIILRRPFTELSQMNGLLDGVPGEILSHFRF